MIDRASARRGHYAVGQAIGIAIDGHALPFTITGITGYGSAVRAAGIRRTAVIVVGRVLEHGSFRESHLYSAWRDRRPSDGGPAGDGDRVGDVNQVSDSEERSRP